MQGRLQRFSLIKDVPVANQSRHDGFGRTPLPGEGGSTGLIAGRKPAASKQVSFTSALDPWRGSLEAGVLPQLEGPGCQRHSPVPQPGKRWSPLLGTLSPSPLWPGSGPASTVGASRLRASRLWRLWWTGAPGGLSPPSITPLGSQQKRARQAERWASSWASTPIAAIKLKTGSPDGPGHDRAPGAHMARPWRGPMAGIQAELLGGCQGGWGPEPPPVSLFPALAEQGVVLVEQRCPPWPSPEADNCRLSRPLNHCRDRRWWAEWTQAAENLWPICCGWLPHVELRVNIKLLKNGGLREAVRGPARQGLGLDLMLGCYCRQRPSQWPRPSLLPPGALAGSRQPS